MLAQDGPHGIPVHSDVVFVGENLEEARRFARTADFVQEFLYGTGEIFGGQLQEFGSATVTHQMLLIDPTIDRLFFRARLAPGAGSAPKIRDDFLWAARKAYDALPGTSKRQNCFRRQFMKRKLIPTSLKCAIAFAFCSLCIFLYNQQGPLSGGDARQAGEDDCCYNCGSVEACENGTDDLMSGFEGCDIDPDEWPTYQVLGDYCDCD